jgi:hypothetical protein
MKRGVGKRLDSRCLPNSWNGSFPARLRFEIDLVTNAALLIEPLQIRQERRVRELHRSGCWPRRSSHGRDPLGYRPCTLAPRPAPKSTATLCYIDPGSFSLMSFSGKRAAKFSKKNIGRGNCLSASQMALPKRIQTLPREIHMIVCTRIGMNSPRGLRQRDLGGARSLVVGLP